MFLIEQVPNPRFYNMQPQPFFNIIQVDSPNFQGKPESRKVFNIAKTVNPIYKVRCVCDSKIGEGNLVKCPSCKTFQHSKCLNIKDNENQKEEYLCILCYISKNVYPMLESVNLDKIFIEPTKLSSSEYILNIDENLLIDPCNPKNAIFLIVLKLGSQGQYKFEWPSDLSIMINSIQIPDFKSPMRLSKSQGFIQGNNKIQFISNNSDFNESEYIFTIIEGNRLNIQHFIENKIKRPTLEESYKICTQKIVSNHSLLPHYSSANSKIDLIKLPGNSAKCAHLDAYDLSDFVTKSEQDLIWTCPICGCDSKELVIDTFLENVLEMIKSKSLSIKKLILTAESEYILNEEMRFFMSEGVLKSARIINKQCLPQLFKISSVSPAEIIKPKPNKIFKLTQEEPEKDKDLVSPPSNSKQPKFQLTKVSAPLEIPRKNQSVFEVKKVEQDYYQPYPQMQPNPMSYYGYYPNMFTSPNLYYPPTEYYPQQPPFLADGNGGFYPTPDAQYYSFPQPPMYDNWQPNYGNLAQQSLIPNSQCVQNMPNSTMNAQNMPIMPQLPEISKMSEAQIKNQIPVAKPMGPVFECKYSVLPEMKPKMIKQFQGFCSELDQISKEVLTKKESQQMQKFDRKCYKAMKEIYNTKNEATKMLTNWLSFDTYLTKLSKKLKKSKLRKKESICPIDDDADSDFESENLLFRQAKFSELILGSEPMKIVENKDGEGFLAIPSDYVPKRRKHILKKHKKDPLKEKEGLSSIPDKKPEILLKQQIPEKNIGKQLPKIFKVAPCPSG